VEIFDRPTASKVTNYLLRNYLKHYRMYKYVFTPIVRANFSKKKHIQQFYHPLLFISKIGLDLNIEYPNRTPTPSKESDGMEESTLDIEKRLKNESSVTFESNSMEKNSISLRNKSQDATKMATMAEMREFVRKLMVDHLDSNQMKEKLERLASSTNPELNRIAINKRSK
jgi:hypothetical protein